MTASEQLFAVKNVNFGAERDLRSRPKADFGSLSTVCRLSPTKHKNRRHGAYMNWEAIGTVAELVGAIAVVISLIYLASQLRSSSRAFKTSLRDTALKSLMEWNYNMLADPDLGWIFQKGIKDFDSLEERDRARLIHVLFSFFKVFENIYLHYLEGSVDKDVWEQNYKLLSLYASQPGAKNYWNSRYETFHPRFQHLLDLMEQPEIVPGHVFASID